MAKNESLGILSGQYYLHGLVVSEYGVKAVDTYGPYVLDGDAPQVSQEDPETDSLKRKDFVFKIADKATGTGFDKVTALIKYT